jgi:methyl-accepting chemotaxis protein
MRDDVNERLKSLACSQECMMRIADSMDQWENSQLILEQSTFDAINISDKAVTLSKEGRRLAAGLQECFNEISHELAGEATNKISATINEMNVILQNLVKVAVASSEISHNIEREASTQREVVEFMKCSVDKAMESLDSTVACAELIMADM